MGCLRENGPLRHSGKRPIKEGKRPINANGQFSGTLPWSKTAPLKRPIKRSMKTGVKVHLPHAFLRLKSSKARGGCTFIPTEGVKRHIRQNHPFTKPPFYKGGSFFYLQLELFLSQSSFFAYSPLRRLSDAPSHCPTASKKTTL